MKKIILIFMVCLSLSGCAALDALRALGGGTSSKGHGNDNTVLVGSDQSNGLSTGGKTDVDAENVNGDVTGRDKTNVTGQTVHMNNVPMSLVYGLISLILILIVGFFWALAATTPDWLKILTNKKNKKGKTA